MADIDLTRAESLHAIPMFSCLDEIGLWHVSELATEVSVVYDRLDTVERLLDAKGTISRADVEAYRPNETIEAERMARRDAYLKRVFRMHGEDQPAEKS